jgi:hypothetical protein
MAPEKLVIANSPWVDGPGGGIHDFEATSVTVARKNDFWDNSPGF